MDVAAAERQQGGVERGYVTLLVCNALAELPSTPAAGLPPRVTHPGRRGRRRLGVRGDSVSPKWTTPPLGGKV